MKDNKLIAEFMGVKTITIDRLKSILKQNREDGFISTPQAYTLDELKYDTSWDWLMPVVEKIESQQSEGYNILIEGNNCWIETQGISFEGMAITKLEATYKAVVQFIKEYNQNN